MKRHEAIQNAMLVMNYLSMFKSDAYLTLDINHYSTNIHYYNKDATGVEVKSTAMKLDPLRLAGSTLDFYYNDQIRCYTFDITWEIDYD